MTAASRPAPWNRFGEAATAAGGLGGLFSRFLFRVVPLFAEHAVTLPPDGNNATGRPVARGSEHAHRGGGLHSEGTAGPCPSLGDSVRHGNVRHIRSALAPASSRQRGTPCTGNPPSPTWPSAPRRHSG